MNNNNGSKNFMQFDFGFLGAAGGQNMKNFTAFGPTTIPTVSHAQHSPVLTKKQLNQKYGPNQRAFSTIRKK